MDHSSEQPHEIQIHSMENMLVVPCPKTQQENNNIKSKAQQEQALKCPRCDSINTKFCYYNNYSLSQPRYFCKSCRRYWTKGGTLRNIPVGGGCRKNHKRSSPPSSSLSSSKKSHDHQPFTANSNSNPMMLIDGHSHFPSLAYDSSSTDLSLAFAKFQNQSNGQMGLFESQNNFHNMYYGFGSGSSGELENGVQMPSFEGYNGTAAVTVPAMKQEVCNGDQNMVLWGFPWQFSNNGGGNYSADIDSAERERWNFNGNNGTFWHGLVNSPLM